MTRHAHKSEALQSEQQPGRQASKLMQELALSHVEFYVGDVNARQRTFIERYGFTPVALSGPA